MATARIAVTSGTRGRRSPRLFFILMLALAVGILGFAFVPEFYHFAKGTFPIEPIVHVHAALMAAWVGAFGVQVYLGATGKRTQHQRVGRYAIAFGWAAWASMIFVEWRALLVHPLPNDMPIYDELLPGPYVYLSFPIFLAWAYRERRRPMWHKRLMVFALFLSLTAAAQRYLWLPMNHTWAGYWPVIAFIDVSFLVPLVWFDLATLRGRLHPATVRGLCLLFAIQALTLSLWGTSAWRTFAFTVGHAARRIV